MSRGVVYIAWGEEARSRSRLSAESLARWHPELPIRCYELPDGCSLLAKSRMHELSPFETTLYLDCDTTILGRLDYGFERAETFGLACRINEVPWAKRWGDFPADSDLIEYNTGVLFFDRGKMAGLFEAWTRGVGKSVFHHTDGRVFDQLNDQPSFAAAVHELGINPFVLPRNWNFRPSTDIDAQGPIKVWHDWQPPGDGLAEFCREQTESRHIRQVRIDLGGST